MVDAVKLVFEAVWDAMPFFAVFLLGVHVGLCWAGKLIAQNADNEEKGDLT